MKKGMLALLLVFSISASAVTTSSSMNYNSTGRANSTSTDTQNSYTVDSKNNTNTKTATKYKLIVNSGGTGSGRVESRQINVSFGNVAKINKGSKVTLKAVPIAGSKFSNWGGACAGVKSDTCTVTISKDKSVLANFKAEVKALTNSDIKSVDSNCAVNAVTKRDTGIVSNMIQQNQRLVDAVNARKAAQISAFGKDASARVKALKEANKSYTTTQETINNQTRDNRGAIISTYRSEMKVCGLEDNETN